MRLQSLLFGLCLHIVKSLDSSDLDTILVEGVEVKDSVCVYEGQRFSSDHEPGGCRLWTCNKHQHTVSIMGCAELPPGCTRSTSTGTYPSCCEKTCVETKKPACNTPEDIPLQEGDEYNSTNPCVKYTCSNGEITKVECPPLPAQNDPSCQPTVDKGQPFPGCCPPAVACPVGKRRRK